MINGSIAVSTKGKLPVVYVYVDDLADPEDAPRPSRSIVQKNLQFSPRLLVVPAGTKVAFPNKDKELHSVFSPAPSYMDLGRYAKDKDKSYVFEQPGEVDIYCDIHAQMSAKVMVMPSSRFVEVASDGTFSLEVPAGRHTIAVWTPDQPHGYSKKVNVKAGETTAMKPIKITPGDPNATHLDKSGKPYDDRYH